MSSKNKQQKNDEKIINEALLASALICDADEACLYVKENKQSYKIKFSWNKPNVFRDELLLSEISEKNLFWCLSRVLQEDEIFISKIGNLNDIAPADLALLEEAKVGSLAMLPVFCDEKLEAVFVLYKYGSVKEWKEGEKSFLRMVASVFSLQTVKNKAISKYVNLKEKQKDKDKLSEDFTNYFENLPTAVIITDVDGDIEYVNQTFSKITGYSKKEAYGQKPSILKSEEMDQEIYEELWKTIKSGKSWHGEVLNRRKNGEMFWQDSRISPVFDNNNNITHYIAINDDVSEVRFLREKIEEELHNKSNFISFISHEIRTPLNGIYGLTSSLLETKIDEKQEDTIKTIISSCNSLEQILSDVLDLSKIESQRMKLDNVVFDLRLLLDGVIKLMIPDANQKNIGLSADIDNDVGRFFIGDPLRLRQVIVNLLNNAIKFTEKGGITISVSNAIKQKKKQTLIFKIKDTGIGMIEEEGARIFKEFSQADPSITSKYGGTGLGLSICHNLINLMNGEIGFESTPDKGSFFWFKLPLKKSSQKSEDSEDLFLDNTQEPKLKPLNILLVEDNIINIKVAISFLGKRGHNITVVHNGEDAVEAICSSDFDIVLMDINMPIMDGFEATKRIRKIDSKEKSQIPIIALTGDTDLEDKEKYFASGMDWYINKPIYMPELLNVIAKFSPKEKLDNINCNFKNQKNAIGEESQWLDIVAIETLISEIDKNDVLSLFKDFFAYAEEQVEKIKEAVKFNQYENIRLLTHSFKSTTASIGLAKFSDLNAKIELECKKQNYKNVKNLCFEIDEIYQKSISELIKQYVKLI